MPRKSTAKERLTDAALTILWQNSYGTASVDAICEKAQVQKGSFYHFFKSKADLAAEALETSWRQSREELDRIFSAATPPLERLERYFEFAYAWQEEQQQKCGTVLGCPLYSVGSEVCTQEEALRHKIQEIMDRKLSYMESAIRDAHAAGTIEAPDAKAKAHVLFAFIQGALTQARIENDLAPLKNLYPSALALLGAKAAVTV